MTTRIVCKDDCIRLMTVVTPLPFSLNSKRLLVCHVLKDAESYLVASRHSISQNGAPTLLTKSVVEVQSA